MNIQKTIDNLNCEKIVSCLDLNKGDIVYVCSDITGLLLYAKKNKIKFEPNIFIDSLKDKIGLGGTLLFPTFNWDFCKNKAFDIINTPSQCGALTNIVLKRKDFKRSRHPIYSFAVWGKDQKKLLQMNNTSSWGEDSPFAYLFKNKAKNLFVGLDYKKGFTMDHYFEQKNNVKYRYHKNFSARYIDNNIVSTKTYSMFVRDEEKIDCTAINPLLDNVLIENKAYKKYLINNNYFGIINLDIAGKIINKDLQNSSKLIYPLKN